VAEKFALHEEILLDVRLISLIVAVKATGVILLLGVGSLVCYKICNHYWPRPRPRPRSCQKDTLVIIQPQNCTDQLLEDLEDAELTETEVSNESLAASIRLENDDMQLNSTQLAHHTSQFCLILKLKKVKY
jgi:hypothetical protein